MDISALRALVALREHSSFARVSEQVNLSASAVFCQIRQLEDQLGQKLYERRSRLLQLTETGALLANFADKILYMHDSALDAHKSSGASMRELIRLGCGPAGSVEIVPYLLRALVRQSPKVEIRMTSADDNTLLSDLRSGILDVLLMSLPAEAPELEMKHLWTYEVVLVFPPQQSGRFTNPQIQDLRKTPFILYRRPVLLDEAYQRMCLDLGFEPNVITENDEPESIKEMVKIGLGVSFLPLWQVAEEAEQGTLRILHLPKPQFYKYGLLYRKSVLQPKALLGLITVAQHWKRWWPLSNHVSRPDPRVEQLNPKSKVGELRLSRQGRH
jgi:DNA-binding transcriptional LysR family regulator